VQSQLTQRPVYPHRAVLATKNALVRIKKICLLVIPRVIEDKNVTGTTQKPKPNSHQFSNYLRDEVQPILEANYSRQQVWVLMGLMAYLEQQRFDYSADRAFQTRPISNAAIAAHMKVTERTVRRWMCSLEKLGIIRRVQSKNPKHKYKNLLNRISLASFRGWFRGLLARTPDSQCPPNKKDINISINHKKNSEEKREENRTFPSSGSIRYNQHWKDIALKCLPSGSRRPCMDMIAKKFRENIKGHGLSLSHGSMTTRWTRFCQNAKPV